MIRLSNKRLDIKINPAGAELWELIDKKTGQNLLFAGEERCFSHRSPNIFPFVGRLKNDRYTFKGKEYSMGLHGFAKDSVFKVASHRRRRVVFSMSESAATLEQYPFKFTFIVSFRLCGGCVKIEYSVRNRGCETMFFGIGAHPGFILPCSEGENGTNIDGNYLLFDSTENPRQHTVDDKESLISGTKDAGYLDCLPLTKAAFKENNTYIFSGLKSKGVTLVRKDGVKIRISLGNAPVLAVWSHDTSGGFVCVEPWLGLPDNVSAKKELSEKDVINPLAPGKIFKYRYSISVQ